MTNLLMRTPLPNNDESPRAYITRLGEENGYATPQVIVDLARGKSQYTITTGWNYSFLQEILGSRCVLPPDFGYRLPGKEIRESAKLIDVPVQDRHLGLRKARLCGQCLRECGYVPAAWDLKAYLACPIHGCLMTKHCHVCGRRVLYARPGCAVCQCGADLRDAPIVPAPDALVAFCEILHSLATGRDDVVVQAYRLGMPVDALLKMDLDVYLRIAVVMANVFHSMEEVRVGNRSDSRVAESLPDVAEVFSAWPAKFHSLCRAWELHPAKKSVDAGFQEHFSWLFARLHKNLKGRRDQTSFLLKEAYQFRANADSPRVPQIRKAWVEPEQVPSTRYGSARDAAMLLGVNQCAITRWAAMSRIPAVRFGRGEKKYWCVDLHALKQTKFSMFKGVALRDSARVLGLSLAVTRILRDRKLFPEEYILRGDSRTVAYEDLVSFKEGLFGRCTDVPKNQKTLELRDAFYKLPAVKQADLICAIAKGEIVPYGRNPQEVLAIRIAGDGARSTSTRHRSKESGPAKAKQSSRAKFLTQSQAVHMFGLWRVEATAIFLKLGCHQLKSRGIEPIKIERLKHFLSKHVLVRTIAKNFDLWTPQLLWELRKARPRSLLILGGSSRKSKGHALLIPRAHLPYVKKIAQRLASRVEQARRLAKSIEFQPTPFR